MALITLETTFTKNTSLQKDDIIYYTKLIQEYEDKWWYNA